MKQTINCHEFINQFDSLRPNNFTRDALIMMFEYFEEHERDIGEEIEFDPIAICCEYLELSAHEFVHQYRLEKEIDGMTDDQIKEFISEYIEENALYVGRTDNGSFVFQQF
jgi:hypothetical protein